MAEFSLNILFLKNNVYVGNKLHRHMPYTKELNNNREKICFVLSQYHYRHKQRKLSLVNFHKKDTQNMVCEVRKT